MRSRATIRRIAAAVGVVVAVSLTMGAGSAGAIASQAFANCDEARAAGFSDIRRGDPQYSPHLDHDNNGIACESTSAPAPGADDRVPVATTPGTEVRGTSVEAAPGELAETGVTSWILAVLGLTLYSAGRRAVTAADRQRRSARLRRSRPAATTSGSWTGPTAPSPDLPPLRERRDEFPHQN